MQGFEFLVSGIVFSHLKMEAAFLVHKQHKDMQRTVDCALPVLADRWRGYCLQRCARTQNQGDIWLQHAGDGKE